MPFMENHEDVKKVTKRNILTEGLVSTYPFISSSIFDENGIYIGTNIYNNSLVFIDRYDTNKYKNANLSIEQYVIDPDREYFNLCEKLGRNYDKNWTNIKFIHKYI